MKISALFFRTNLLVRYFLLNKIFVVNRELVIILFQKPSASPTTPPGLLLNRILCCFFHIISVNLLWFYSSK